MKAFQLLNIKTVAAICIATALPALSMAEPQAVENREHCAGPTNAFHDHIPDGAMREGMPPPGMPSMNGMMPPGGADVFPFLHDLKLTEAQEDKIFSITHATAPLLREQLKRIQKSDDDMRDMLAISGQYDEDKFKRLAEANGHAMAELMILRARDAHQIFALLTTEQRTQAESKRVAFAEHASMCSHEEDMRRKGDAPH